MTDFIAALFVFVVSIAIIISLFLFAWYRFHADKQLSVASKAVLISGCDSGIGLRVAEHLHDQGFHVFAACLSLESQGHQLLNNRSRFCENRMIPFQLDITSRSSISDATSFVEKKIRELDLTGLWALVNNAGVCIYGEFDWLTWDHMYNQVNVNLLGTISLTKAFLPLVKQAKGRIVNVGSVNGICAYPGISVYCATKFAIEGFSDVLRHEMRKLGVKVILIRPGDFARLTGIMGRQALVADEMWNQMPDREKTFYSSYFQDYHKHIQKNYGLTSPVSFEKSTLLSDFESALLSDSPPYAMTVSPIRYQLFFALLRVLPVGAKDHLIDWLYARVFGFDAGKYFAAGRQ